jgi:hypothetical protein
MIDFPDAKTAGLLGAVLIVLGIATTIGQILKRRTDTNLNPEVVRHFHLRIRTWWFVCAILAATFMIGRPATVVLFGLLSFWALREFVTLTPTRPGDHRPLFWVFFILHAAAICAGGNGTVWAVQHSDSRLLLSLYPGANRLGRRLQAVSGADRQDPVRPDDLRLLPELCPGAIEPAVWLAAVAD